MEFSMSSSPSTPTRDVVLNLLHAVQTGDGDAISALYADAVEFSVNWPETEIGGRVPWIRHRRTAGDMAHHFAEIAAGNRPNGEGTIVEAILVDGPDAVVFGTLHNRVVASGSSYVARFALRLTVIAGRITRHSIYEDSLSVFRAFDARE